jgi:hypothetical protein
MDAVQELRGGDRRDAHLSFSAEDVLKPSTHRFQGGIYGLPAQRTFDLDEDGRVRPRRLVRASAGWSCGFTIT